MESDYPILLNIWYVMYLVLNMINLLSCQQMCVPNHMHVQLSVVELNVQLDSTFTHHVILNIINSWVYMNLKWYKPDHGKCIMWSRNLSSPITTYRIFLYTIGHHAQKNIDNLSMQLSWVQKIPLTRLSGIQFFIS